MNTMDVLSIVENLFVASYSISTVVELKRIIQERCCGCLNDGDKEACLMLSPREHFRLHFSEAVRKVDIDGAKAFVLDNIEKFHNDPSMEIDQTCTWLNELDIREACGKIFRAVEVLFLNSI